MWLDALVIDLLRPSGASHTIVVKPKTNGDHVITGRGLSRIRGGAVCHGFRERAYSCCILTTAPRWRP